MGLLPMGRSVVFVDQGAERQRLRKKQWFAVRRSSEWDRIPGWLGAKRRRHRVGTEAEKFCHQRSRHEWHLSPRPSKQIMPVRHRRSPRRLGHFRVVDVVHGSEWIICVFYRSQ
jgi:hypothetical protein